MYPWASPEKLYNEYSLDQVFIMWRHGLKHRENTAMELAGWAAKVMFGTGKTEDSHDGSWEFKGADGKTYIDRSKIKSRLPDGL